MVVDRHPAVVVINVKSTPSAAAAVVVEAAMPVEPKVVPVEPVAAVEPHVPMSPAISAPSKWFSYLGHKSGGFRLDVGVDLSGLLECFF